MGCGVFQLLSHVWIQVVLASDLYANISEMSWCGQSRSLWTGTAIRLYHLWHHQAKRWSLVQIPFCPQLQVCFFFHVRVDTYKTAKQNKTKNLLIYFYRILFVQKLEDLLIHYHWCYPEGCNRRSLFLLSVLVWVILSTCSGFDGQITSIFLLHSENHFSGV